MYRGQAFRVVHRIFIPRARSGRLSTMQRTMSAESAASGSPLSFDAPENIERPRTGRLLFRSRKEISTPHFIATSSKGCIPHLTQDNMRTHTSVPGIYTALEDCMIAQAPASRSISALAHPGDDSPLRGYICLQDDALLVLGPRRSPAIPAPLKSANTATSIHICASTGFTTLEILEYIDAAQKLRPDIVLAVPDIELEKKAPGRNRQDKMDERTHAWVRAMRNTMATQSEGRPPAPSLWAPLLPIEPEMQRSYRDYLQDCPADAFGGLSLYSNDSLLAIPENMQHLPRLMLTQPATPHDILTAVELGADLLTLPFITAASEAGLAFNFSFPAPLEAAAADPPGSQRPLSVDLASATHATDLSPLVPSCTCFACTSSHRAYVRHLLSVGEMLAWVLLQIHNHHVISEFFAGIRRSITDGTFDAEADRFRRTYEAQFPDSSSEGPRTRGYMTRSSKQKAAPLNKPPWEKLDPQPRESPRRSRAVDEKSAKTAESVEAGLFGDNLDAQDLERLGSTKISDEQKPS